MSVTQSAEAVLIVIKRLGKWALWLIAALAILGCLIAGGVWAWEYIANRPHAATRYADLNLGDPQKEVLYAFGPPPFFIDPTPVKDDGNVFSAFGRVVDSKDINETLTYNDSTVWMYSDKPRIELSFDKPGGRVVSITCFSEGSNSCPALYGLRTGSGEDDVLSQLGKPGSEKLEGVTKTMRYPQYNLVVFLEKRRVYMLKLSENAAL